ncbi:MAG: response regulator [Thiovulaceae bacterium]|nr:response regulator [Sulfurimonadaceae bacterium]
MKSKILIVDDTLKNIQLAANVLKDTTDYSILYATSGKDALARIAENEIHLVLLDIMMPEMDGFEVAQKLKSESKSVDIPIIFLSANNDAKSIDKGFEIGGSDYISKPFIPNELKNRVRTHLELFHSRRQIKSELDEKSQILEQYKEVVDESSIVSKTDLKGMITYVNQNFCDISHYTEEELLGKPQNIIRHPDVPKQTYEELWNTIQAKKTWHGILKNKNKEGKAYYVDSVVTPILDTKGEITEYISSRHDITRIYKLKDELRQNQTEILNTLGEVGETRSQETGEHVKRVAEISYLLAIHYGVTDKKAELLRSASPMHDIGKIAIPDAVLLKAGKLDDAEWEIMKEHARYGHEIFKSSSRPLLQAAATIAHEHHEKWDGSGYPRGLKADEIHVYGRITAIADVFDALLSERSYKKAWSFEKAFDYIREHKGSHFDPDLVDIFLERKVEVQELWESF